VIIAIGGVILRGRKAELLKSEDPLHLIEYYFFRTQHRGQNQYANELKLHSGTVHQTVTFMF